jgi:hypothetical protein
LNHRPLGYEGDTCSEPIPSSLFGPRVINEFRPFELLEEDRVAPSSRPIPALLRPESRAAGTPLMPYRLPTLAGTAAYSRAFSGLPQAV